MPIYDRAMVREKAIWPSFLYGMPGAASTKDIVFGLYATSYLLGHNYLKDIEAEELQRLVDAYDSNMSELDVDEQNLVLEIASKRYLETIKIQIEDNGLATKTQQLAADEQEYDVKLTALSVDQEALETKRAQIGLERDRAVLKNKDLESRIQLEELAQNYVAVEISQKELEAARAELRVLTTALKGLEIQTDIANVGLQITQAELSKSQIEADIAGIDARIAGENLSTKRLEVDQAGLDAMQYEIDNVTARKIQLIEAKGEAIEADTTNIEVLEGKESEIRTAQTTEQNARKHSTLSGFNDRTSAGRIDMEQQGQSDALVIDMAENHNASQIVIETRQTELPEARISAASTAKNAAIDAAETLATADITTSLTHEIGSA